jgi:hypothetical protein
MATVTIIVPPISRGEVDRRAWCADTTTVIAVRGDHVSRTSGINTAASKCTSDYMVLVGEGLEPQESCVPALVDYAERTPRAGAVGGLLLAEDGSILSAGIAIGPDHVLRPLYGGVPADHPAVSKSRRMQVVGTDLMVVRRSAWNDVGGLDESHDGAYLDADFCLRLREFGWETHLCHESRGRMRTKRLALESRGGGDVERAFRRKWAHRISSDEFQYYWDDGLIRFEQRMLYPLGIELKAPLSPMQEPFDDTDAVEMLRAQSQCMLEMVCDNIRMKAWCAELNHKNGKSCDPEEVT